MSTQIGIDLGTSNVVIFINGKGVALKEATAISVNKKNGKIVAIGDEAKKLEGRTNTDIITIMPIKDGIITDYDITEKMLKYFIRKALGRRSWRRPILIMSVPSNTTEIEKEYITQALLQVGARKVYLIAEPIAAALGAGIDISKPEGNMIINIGAGLTNISVTSFGEEVTSVVIKIGGNDFDKEIVNYLRDKYELIISKSIAEEIKIKLGINNTQDNIKAIEVSGRDYINGTIRSVNITNYEIKTILEPICEQIIFEIQDIIDKLSPELISDISHKGIIISGGSSLLNGLDDIIESKTGLSTFRIDEPIKSVAIGAGKYLKYLRKY